MLIRSDDADFAPALDMTPMIDMVFNLLIFFLVATTFQQTERQMNIALPFSKAAGPISANLRELVINVDARGEIVLGGKPISAVDLEQTVKSAVADNPQRKVTVRGDRNAEYGSIVRVLDICKRSGVQQPYLDTVVE
ncbi:MAG: ExbD/TolR family protein [Phycisphaerae bacterium]